MQYDESDILLLLVGGRVCCFDCDADPNDDDDEEKLVFVRLEDMMFVITLHYNCMQQFVSKIGMSR